MRIAILMTNTDESAFAHRWPLDGEKWTRLMQMARPAWDYPVWRVKDGVFPDRLNAFDGAIITGSPASVNSGADWVARLEELVRAAYAEGKPLFGACFGHQVIAMALGGVVGKNPDGWVFGQIESVPVDESAPMSVYASHSEQVLRLPDGARVIAEGPGCRVGGYRIGHTVLTTQYHPEMEPDFQAALIEELEGDLPDGVCEAARASMKSEVPDMAAWAEIIARIFEAAQAR